MACQFNTTDEFLKYARDSLPGREAAVVSGHLDQCEPCRLEMAHIRQLLDGMAELSSEHLPVEVLIQHHGSKEQALFPPDRHTWEKIERHLLVCAQCRAELELLSDVEAELGGMPVEPESAQSPGPEDPHVKHPARKRAIGRAKLPWRYALAAAAVMIMVAIPTLFLRSQGPTMAVLPFQYSGPAEKEFFALGLGNEITAHLEKVNTVAVTSANSTSQYKDTKKPPGQIGRELGVQYLLTGLVQWQSKEGVPRLQVVPRIIRAADGSELWSEDFQLDWEEVCNLSGQVTLKAVSALNVEFLEPQMRAMEFCPTSNIEAYESYLRGNILWNQSREADALQRMVGFYRKALEMDSGFALAYVMLSRALTELYWHHRPGESMLLAESRTALDHATELAPGLPEYHLALASAYYHELKNDSALAQFAIAESGLPNSGDLWEELGYLHRRMGQWDQSVASLKKSLELDPRDAATTHELGQCYKSMRDFDEAERTFRSAIDLLTEPNPRYYGELALLYELQGDTEELEALKAGNPGEAAWKDYLDLEAPLRLASLAGAPSASDSLKYYTAKALLNRNHKHSDAVVAYGDSALALRERVLGAQPDNAEVRSLLAVVYALLGRKDEAIHEAMKATELVPMSKDAGVFGPVYIDRLAQIYTMVGEYEKALDLIEYLLSVPSHYNAAMLRSSYSPFRDLRDHPRFQRLLERPPRPGSVELPA